MVATGMAQNTTKEHKLLSLCNVMHNVVCNRTIEDEQVPSCNTGIYLIFSM